MAQRQRKAVWQSEVHLNGIPYSCSLRQLWGWPLLCDAINLLCPEHLSCLLSEPSLCCPMVAIVCGGALKISDWPDEPGQYHLNMLWPFTCSVCVWQTDTEAAGLSAPHTQTCYFPLRKWWVKSAWMTSEVSGILIIFATNMLNKHTKRL